jgi:hypothetical protein
VTVDEIAQAARKAGQAGDMDRYFELLDQYDAARAAEEAGEQS